MQLGMEISIAHAAIMEVLLSRKGILIRPREEG